MRSTSRGIKKYQGPTECLDEEPHVFCFRPSEATPNPVDECLQGAC